MASFATVPRKEAQNDAAEGSVDGLEYLEPMPLDEKE